MKSNIAKYNFLKISNKTYNDQEKIRMLIKKSRGKQSVNIACVTGI